MSATKVLDKDPSNTLVQIAWGVIEEVGAYTKLIVHDPKGKVCDNGNGGRWVTLVDWPKDLRDTQVIIGAVWPTGYFTIVPDNKIEVRNYRAQYGKWLVALNDPDFEVTDVSRMTDPNTIMQRIASDPRDMVCLIEKMVIQPV